jgi:hypothetical protein
MGEHTITRQYDAHYGIDLKSNDLTRQKGFAESMLNAQYRKSGSIEKRPGYQAHGVSQGGCGDFTYNRVNPTTSLEEQIQVSFDQTPYKLLFSTMTVTYTGTESTVTVSVFFDTVTSQYRCQLSTGTTQVLDMALGLGFDEASPVTIDQLRAAIDALADFTATLSGSTATPAAFLKIVRDYDLSASGAPYAGVAGYYSAINTTVANPFSTYYGHRFDTDFENVSGVQIDNILYVSNGYDEVHKYDGQTFYRAGVPTPASVAAAIGAATGITGNNYQYRIRYVQKDAVGNFIEGNLLSTTNSGLNPANQKVDVTLANVQAGTGFNTNCATVNGNQVGVTTITVNNSPHTLKVNDTAYFLDRSSGLCVERTVTAIAATTATISGAAVNVNSGDVISNNLRIEIWRNKTSASFPPTSWYLLAEIANNSLAATQTYTDSTADASLGAQLVEPLTDRSVPPKCKYISKFKNQTVFLGSRAHPNTVYWADVEGPEYWPSTGDNEVDVNTPGGEIVVGGAENNEVFVVFKNPGIIVVSGNIVDGTVSTNQISTDIGLAAHATIREFDGTLGFLSTKGPYKMVGGQIPTPLGTVTDPETKQIYGRLEPVFDQRGLTTEQKLVLKKAVAINDSSGSRYILYIPAESTSGANRYPNSNSRIFAYDYSRDAWLEWNNMNMAGGITLVGEELYFKERRYSTFSASVVNLLYRRHNLNDAWDYEDNNQPVTWDYGPQWEDLGYPSVLKRFLRLNLYALEEDDIFNNEDAEIGITTEVNFIKDSQKADVTLTYGGSGYGISAYGTSSYGDPADGSRQKKLNSGRFGSLRPRFHNEEHQKNVIISGWELEIATPYKLRIKD